MDISGDAVFGIGIVVFKKPETVFDQIIEILYIFLSTTDIFLPVELMSDAGIVDLVDPVVPHLESAFWSLVSVKFTMIFSSLLSTQPIFSDVHEISLCTEKIWNRRMGFNSVLADFSV